MKKFRFCYTLTVWLLLALVAILSTIGLVWNIFNLSQTLKIGGFKVFSYSIIIVLTAFLLIFSISVAVYGKYVVKNGCVYSYFGFVKSKFNIQDVSEITHFKKSNKLVVYFTDNSYTVIVISPEFYSEFVLSLREQNKSIVYNVKIDGEETPNS